MNRGTRGHAQEGLTPRIQSNPGSEITLASFGTLPRNDTSKKTSRENRHLAWSYLSQELEELKDNSLYREPKYLDSIDGVHGKVDGKDILLFCSNDYLGLGQDPLIREAFEKGVREFGAGAGAARLISGSSCLTQKLEERFAVFKQKEKALLFTTGYLANVGTISALCDDKDLVVIDKLCHASIIDGCKLSGATLRVYPHGDTAYLEKILKSAHQYRRTLIVTDAVFSMDGDLAPLPRLAELKRKYDAWLMIDEAHGTGVFGEQGRGAAEFLGVENEIDITVSTLSKAAGVLGGLVAGSRDLIDYLINKSRPFIFSTASPPSVVAAALKALDLIESEPARREILRERVRQLKTALKKSGIHYLDSCPSSPIIPILIGNEDKALTISKQLFEKGFWVPAVRYPTVPKGKARLRMTISAVHTPEEIKQLMDYLCGVSKKFF